MATVQFQGTLPFTAASVVEDVLQQHGSHRSRDLDLDARRAEEAAVRRCEAAAWLRKAVGVVVAKDLPAEPTEEEFRLGLRSGIILCNALNKVQPASVQKVVESPCDAVQIPDGAALSAYQYFENVRNFLMAAEELGLPNFEASDLEQGGKSSRVVNCVLALKSYDEWKRAGGNGVWKFGGNVKTSGKQFVRKNSEPFSSSLPRSVDSSTAPGSSLSLLVRSILLDKKPEEVPNLVESVLSKVVEEFEHRVTNQIELNKACFKESTISHTNKSSPTNFNQKTAAISNRDTRLQKKTVYDKETESRLLKQQSIVNQQQKDIVALKQNILTAKAGMQFMQMKFHEELRNLGLHVHGLAHAASGYHKVLDENRKLYNQVQDLKGSIRVYCRVRPFLNGQCNYLTTMDHIEEGTITINTLVKNGKVRKTFNFNRVFGPSATQEEVFSDTQPLIRSVLDGYNVCIFAYGQTGSGKTYTMTGPRDVAEHSQGVNYRALRDLFLLAEQRKDTFCYDVSVQMIEIYNEQVRDLLNIEASTKRLEIRNSSQTGLSVPDASLFRVSSTSDILELMSLGQRNRAVGSTALNDRSSRSHSCLTVHVQGRDLISGSIVRGCMHLVDLAGSERVDKSQVTGDRLKEAQHINRSLSALGDVISSLAQKSSHVPYRNSKLTQLLQDSLGGQAKTLMFVHISPEPDAIGETISTLKFAERVATVELGAARVNKDSGDVKELKEQIASLKAALARKDGDQKMQQQFQLMQAANGPRKSMDDFGNIGVHRKPPLREKRQSLDLDELLGNNGSMWPPVRDSHCSQLNNEDDDDDNNDDDDDGDREVSSGEWVDKLMVNKQDFSRGIAGSWDRGDLKFQMDSSKYGYPFPVANMNQWGFNVDEDVEDEVEGGMWQFNHSKHGSFSSSSSSIDQKVQITPGTNEKQSMCPEIRTMIPRLGASPSRKAVNRCAVEGQPPAPPQTGRQTTERRGKTRSKK